jgi:hypothetical protein
MHRRVDVAKCPFVRGDLAVRVHVPLAQHQDQLALREVWIDHRQPTTLHFIEVELRGWR